MSKKTNKTAPTVEDQTPKESKPPTKEEIDAYHQKLRDDIDKNKLLPPQYKEILKSSVDIPFRMSRMEAYISKLVLSLKPIIQLSNQMTQQTPTPQANQTSQSPQAGGGTPNIPPSAPYRLPTQGQMTQQGNKMQQMLQYLPYINQMLGGGGGESQFFYEIGKQSFLESISMDRVMRRRMLKAMGTEAMTDFKKFMKDIETKTTPKGTGDILKGLA